MNLRERRLKSKLGFTSIIIESRHEFIKIDGGRFEPKSISVGGLGPQGMW